MVCETILHIDEELTDEGRRQVLESIREVTGGMEARHHSEKPHMLFVAFDDERAAPPPVGPRRQRPRLPHSAG